MIVETMGIEPTTPSLQRRCSSQLSYVPELGENILAGGTLVRHGKWRSRTILFVTAELEALADVVRGRRTNLRMDPNRAVEPEVIEAMCELATWAPNHKMTQPWRFAVCTGESRATLGRLTADFQAARGELNEAKLDKTRGKYLRAPAVVLVASARVTDPGRWAEDRDAVSAGVQNMLLAATAAGLASYWGTGAITAAPAVKELCGFGSDDEIVAAVYLGWPIGVVPTPQRQPAKVRWLG